MWWRMKGLKDNRPCHIQWHIGYVAWPGVENGLVVPGAKSRQEGAIYRACRSTTLLRDVIASRMATLKERNFSDTLSMGLKRAMDYPSRYTARS